VCERARGFKACCLAGIGGLGVREGARGGVDGHKEEKRESAQYYYSKLGKGFTGDGPRMKVKVMRRMMMRRSF
jgi:hypothetical protein